MSTEKTGGGTTAKLSVMMFLQFFIWGAWYTMVGQFLSTPEVGMGDAIGWVYTMGPIAAIISPLFHGMVADRFFAGERVLFFLMLLGGIAMFLAPSVAESCGKSWADTQAMLEVQGITVKEKYGTGFFGIFPPIMQRILNNQKAGNYDELLAQGGALRDEYKGLAETDPDKASDLWNQASDVFLQATNWKAVWMYPAAMAGIILVLFHDKMKPEEKENQDG